MVSPEDLWYTMRRNARTPWEDRNEHRNWKRNFFTIWTGQAFSQFSSSVLQFAIVWYLTDQTGSAMVLTIAMMMGFLPQGVLGPFIGVLIERYKRNRIIII